MGFPKPYNPAVTQLKDLLLGPENRQRVIADAQGLVDSEVKSKGGISGFAIKAGYKAVQAIKPGLIREALDNLIDRFVERLEPFYTNWNEGGRSSTFEQFLVGRKNEVANALLGVTDDRAKQSSGTVRKTYESLRPQGEKNVEAAVPGLARIIQRYIPAG